MAQTHQPSSRPDDTESAAWPITHVEVCLRARHVWHVPQRLAPYTPANAAEIFRLKYPGAATEYLELFLLDQELRISRMERVASDQHNIVQTRPQRLMRAACLVDPPATIVIAHNHVWHEPTLSEADLDLAQTVEYLARVLRIAALDYLVIGPDSYTSMAEDGLWPPRCAPLPPPVLVHPRPQNHPPPRRRA